jgi:hypothetical protein
MLKKLLKWLGVGSHRRIEALVRQVAEQSLAEVCQLVRNRMDGMSLAEARGYTRARAAQVVLRNARQVIADSTERNFADLALVTQTATERLLPQVLRQTKVSVPRVTTIRKAA